MTPTSEWVMLEPQHQADYNVSLSRWTGQLSFNTKANQIYDESTR